MAFEKFVNDSRGRKNFVSLSKNNIIYLPKTVVNRIGATDKKVVVLMDIERKLLGIRASIDDEEGTRVLNKRNAANNESESKLPAILSVQGAMKTMGLQVVKKFSQDVEFEDGVLILDLNVDEVKEIK